MLNQSNPQGFINAFAAAAPIAGLAIAPLMSLGAAAMAPSLLYADYPGSFNFGASFQILDNSLSASRVSTAQINEVGKWTTTETITSATQAQQILSLDYLPNQIGPATIQPGSGVVFGTAAPLYGQPGGGFQMLTSPFNVNFGQPWLLLP
jgi:hypothetical protein